MPPKARFFLPLDAMSHIPPRINNIYGLASWLDHENIINMIKAEVTRRDQQRVFITNASEKQCVAADPSKRFLMQASHIASRTGAYHAPLLLADCFSQEMPGTADLRMREESYQGRHHRCPTDPSLILATYAQAHFFTLTHPCDEQHLNIMHHDAKLIRELLHFYFNNTKLLPSKVQLIGRVGAKEIGTVQGMGAIDAEYAHMVRAMAWLAGATDFHSREEGPLRIIQVGHLTENALLSPTYELNLYDFDGSLAHDAVCHAMLAQPSLTSVESVLYQANPILVAHHQQSVMPPIQQIGGNFSARQSFHLDRNNHAKTLTNGETGERQEVWIGSCFKPMKTFIQRLGMHFSPFLIADCFNDLPIGHTYQQLLLGTVDEAMVAQCPLEKRKILLLMGHLHYIQSILPKDSIVRVQIFEDNPGILRELATFVATHPTVLPPGSVSLYYYNGTTLTLQATHATSGTVNLKFATWICDIAKQHAPTIAHFLSVLNTPAADQRQLAYICTHPLLLTTAHLTEMLTPRADESDEGEELLEETGLTQRRRSTLTFVEPEHMPMMP